MSSEGSAILVDAETLRPVNKPKKLHNMPITSCAFQKDKNTLVTASTDSTYKFTNLSDFSALQTVKNLILRLGILFLILMFIADYFY
jgi:WD40 repeat protein